MMMMGYAGMSIFVRSPSNGILQHSRLGKATVTCGTDILLPDTFHSFSIPKTPTAFFFSTTQQLPFSFSPPKLLTFNPPSLYFDLFRSQKLPSSTCPPEKKTHHHRIFCLEPSLFVCSKHHSPWETLRVVLLAVKTALEVRCWPLDMLSNEPH